MNPDNLSPSPSAGPGPRKGALRHGLVGLWLLGALFLAALPGCAEGIVMDPPQRFQQSEIVLPTPEPSATPTPSTPLEKAQVKVVQLGEKAGQYKGFFWPAVIALLLLMGFVQLLRWIFDLTTSSPPVA